MVLVHENADVHEDEQIAYFSSYGDWLSLYATCILSLESTPISPKINGVPPDVVEPSINVEDHELEDDEQEEAHDLIPSPYEE